MRLPDGDRELVQITSKAFADAAQRAGKRLACRPGCTQCCEGTFAINALDVARLHTALRGMQVLAPELAESLQQRALAWIRQYGGGFPGDLTTGLIGTTEDEQARFETFANEAPCPALNPDTGLCDVYEWRPMTCRVFGPPVQVEGGGLACCELCFEGAGVEEIAACEMKVPHDLEEQLVQQVGNAGSTVVAFALCSAL